MFSRSRSRSSSEPSISSSAARLAADDRRGEGVREEVRARALAEQLDDLAAARDVAAAGAAERLAERAGEDVDAARSTPQCSGVPRPLGPMKPTACESSTITIAS